jgi:hypothetical protein
VKPDVVARVQRAQCDNLALAAAFLARRADFVVVGGCALMLRGHDHLPPDLDVVPEPSLANLCRLLDGLTALGTVGRERRPNDQALLAADILRRTTSVGMIDVLVARGLEDYAALESRATSMLVGESEVRVAAVADVLEMRVRFGKVVHDA